MEGVLYRFSSKWARVFTHVMLLMSPFSQELSRVIKQPCVWQEIKKWLSNKSVYDEPSVFRLKSNSVFAPNLSGYQCSHTGNQWNTIMKPLEILATVFSLAILQHYDELLTACCCPAHILRIFKIIKKLKNKVFVCKYYIKAIEECFRQRVI